MAAIIGADLLVLLSDIDGLYTDDPNKNKDAKLIPYVERITDEMLGMAKGPSTDMGTGGMSSKVGAAGIANDAGADMVIINGDDMEHINQLLAGEEIGTLFKAHKTTHFHLKNYLDRMNQEKINRINELYKKQKAGTITPEEKDEQSLLRAEYLAAIRNNLRNTLEHTSIQEPDGTIRKLRKKETH